MEEDVKFNIDEVDKSFVKYRQGDFVQALVVQKREDGVIVNIGGKNDAFAGKDEFDDFDKVRIGDSFKALIGSGRNEENFIVVSKRKADDFIINQELSQNIKIGSEITFTINNVNKFGLNSKLGSYYIFVPISQISTGFVKDVNEFLGKQLSAVVLEIDNDRRKIIVSSKVVIANEQAQTKNLFLSKHYEGEKVQGLVKKIIVSGGIIDVDGYDCFIHISDLDYSRHSNPSEVLTEGETKTFMVLKIDRETGKVNLGLKQLFTDPRLDAIKQLEIDQKAVGEIVKILPFGAILKLENGCEGLLHISNLTDDVKKSVHELVHIGDKIEVYIKDIDVDNQRISFTSFNPNGQMQ